MGSNVLQQRSSSLDTVEQDLDRTMSSLPEHLALPELARRYWDRASLLTRAAAASSHFKVSKREIRTIAIFFHALGIGGGERVTCDLAALWQRMGYRVIVLTNVEPQPGDHNLPEGIERVTLPTYVGITPETYGSRCDALLGALRDYNVDLLVFAQWFSDCLAFDLLSARALGVPVLLFIQSSFSLFFLDSTMPSRHADIPLQYVAANGIVCLSETDRFFWSRFNPNTRVTQNPITCAPSEPPAGLGGHTVLWPARLHADKRPDRVIPIMRELVRIVPDARVLMVGPEDPTIVDAMRGQIEDTLAPHIVFCGPQPEQDMERFYANADAFLLTSEREGWSLALGEALAAGLPCVMYELPYLTLTQGNDAVVGVPQGDAVSAARALADVLTNKDLARSMGVAGRAFMRKLSTYDYRAFWRECFASVLHPDSHMCPSPSQAEQIMWPELLTAYRSHLESFERERGQLHQDIARLTERTSSIAAELEKTRAELENVRASTSLRVGLAVTALPRAAKRLIRK